MEKVKGIWVPRPVLPVLQDAYLECVRNLFCRDRCGTDFTLSGILSVTEWNMPFGLCLPLLDKILNRET